jgi:drug/metabolite transporter (DMT)-like permease
MFGMSDLQPVIYVIVANTEIVFETLMTSFVLKKTVSGMQYFAVFLVVLSVPLSIYDPTPNSSSFGGTNQRLLVGVLLSLASRLASSLNTILAEKFLGEEKRQK